MKKGKKGSTGIRIFIMVLLWICWFRKVEASNLFFPFIADDWMSFEAAPLWSKPQKDKTKKERKEKKAEDSAFCLSASEKEVLYQVVSMECDTGYEGSLAVVSCMLNRLESERYPDDLMDVIQEDAQFSAYYDCETDSYPYKDRVPSKECIAAVDDALSEGKRNLPDYVLYFRSSDYTSLKGYERYKKIGDNMYFYKEEDQ